jgi:hypothetical protein
VGRPYRLTVGRIDYFIDPFSNRFGPRRFIVLGLNPLRYNPNMSVGSITSMFR